MQGGRANIGRQTYNLNGKVATRLGGSTPGQVVSGQGQGQSTLLPPPVPAARVVRPVAATPNVPRAGSREIARVGSAGLVEAFRTSRTGVGS
jgi:hypothetical protein